MKRNAWIVSVALLYGLIALAFVSLAAMDFFFQDAAIALFPALADATPEQFIVGGFVFLALAAVEIVLALFILKQSRVVRVVLIVISSIAVLWAIYGIFFLADLVSIPFLFVNGYVLYALLGPPSVRAIFAKAA